MLAGHEAIVALGFEGTVLERTGSAYRPGRHRAWIKRRARFVACAELRSVHQDRDGLWHALCELDARRFHALATARTRELIGELVDLVYSRVDADGSLREARVAMTDRRPLLHPAHVQDWPVSHSTRSRVHSGAIALGVRIALPPRALVCAPRPRPATPNHVSPCSSAQIAAPSGMTVGAGDDRAGRAAILPGLPQWRRAVVADELTAYAPRQTSSTTCRPRWTSR
jgi:hypothetical protein